MPAVPGPLKGAAIAQLVSGLVSFAMTAILFLVYSASAGTAATILGTIIASFGCPLGCLGVFGYACGIWALPLALLGLLEVIAGIVGLVAPAKSKMLIQIVAVLEILSIIFGGLISLIVGIVALVLMRNESVAEFFAASE